MFSLEWDKKGASIDLPKITFKSGGRKVEISELDSNLLFFGDPLKVLYTITRQFRGLQPKLIFLDLPFYTSEVRAYSEPHTYSIDETVFQNIYLLSKMAKGWLAPDGFFVIKVPSHNSHYIKVVLDEIYGITHFVNEILLKAPKPLKNCPEIELYQRTIPLLVYSVAEKPMINPVYYGKRGGGYWHSMVSKGQGRPLYFQVNGQRILLDPAPGTHWKFKQETIKEMEKKGLIRLNSKGTPEYWVPPNLGQIINTTWWDKESHEVTPLGYETAAIIVKRLLDTFTRENESFLHIFSGTGIGLWIAEKTRRRWVGIEIRQLGIKGTVKQFKKANLEMKTVSLLESEKSN
ncbi:MAG: DNA methyltransferase [Candidatus Helarchaeota archaeon]